MRMETNKLRRNTDKPSNGFFQLCPIVNACEHFVGNIIVGGYIDSAKQKVLLLQMIFSHPNYLLNFVIKYTLNMIGLNNK